MANSTERSWLLVAKQPILSVPAKGMIEVQSTRGFHVKQKVNIHANSSERLVLEVKAVLSDKFLLLGLPGDMDLREDLSAYTPLTNPTIEAPKQPRPSIDEKTYTRAAYQEEPAMAFRSLLVDRLGNDFNEQNPLFVKLSDGSISIGTVNAELEVQLSHIDNSPNGGDVADSVQVGDGETIMKVNPDGSLNVNLTPSNQSPKILSTYNEVLSVAKDDETLIHSLVAPIDGLSFLYRVFFSGDNIGIYTLKLNGTTIDKKRTSLAADFDGVFDFSDASKGLLLAAGDLIEIFVLHERPHVADFNARIQTIKIE